MLERFKDFKTVIVECKDVKEIMLLRQFLINSKLKENSYSVIYKAKVVLIDIENKSFSCLDNIHIAVDGSCDVKFNHYITTFDNVIDLNVKKQMYLTKEQLECIDYVDAELEEYEITDLYYDDNGLVVNYRDIWSLITRKRYLDDFFEML